MSTTDAYMTWLVSMLAISVLFGAGATVVLATPALAAKAATLIPAVVVASVVMSIPIANAIAPRMRLRFQRQQDIRQRVLDIR